MAEFDAGIGRGELPVDLPLIRIGGLLPGGELSVEGVEVGDAPVEALAGEGGQFDLGDVEPRAVAGRVVDLQALRQRRRPWPGRTPA